MFCIHLQRQYSASRDLLSFHDHVKNVNIKHDEAAQRYLKALQKGLSNEKTLNDNYMKNKRGQNVHFSDVIQLYHVKSRKYLTVYPGKLAEDERENTRLNLDVNGNSFSWLSLIPRFKINKEGDKINTGAEFYLKVAEKTNEFVHSADRDPAPGYQREVNCALEMTSWKLQIFQSTSDSSDERLLLYSELVYINDPETRSNVTFSEKY